MVRSHIHPVACMYINISTRHAAHAVQQSCLLQCIISWSACFRADADASGPVDALLALASPPPPAAVEPASALTLTAIPHHVATQRTGAQSFPLVGTQH